MIVGNNEHRNQNLSKLHPPPPSTAEVPSMAQSVATNGSQEQHYLTSLELAERLRTTAATVKHWRLHRKGPMFIRVGKKVVYPIAEVEAWERQQLELEQAKRDAATA